MMRKYVRILIALSALVYLSGCGFVQYNLLKNYPNGQPKFRGNITDMSASKMGLWTYYFENGKTQAVGSYTFDHMVGEWTWFYPSGKKFKTQGFTFNLFIDPYADGPYLKWTEEDTVLIKGQFSNNGKTGVWEFRNTKNVKVLELEFSGDKRNGYCNMWFSTPGYEGNRKVQCNFVDGKHDGLYKAWDKDGNLLCEATLDKGKIVSVRLYGPDGAIIPGDELSKEQLNKHIDIDLEYLKTMEGLI
jgi:antitoxin component YwqK of YwqJK toxin-antitoxin module